MTLPIDFLSRWRRTPLAARPALATLFVLVVGCAWFVARVWVESACSGLSPLTLIWTPPAPGAPSVWLGWFLCQLRFRRPQLLRCASAERCFASSERC